MSRIHDAFLETLRVEHGEPPSTFNCKKMLEIIKSEPPFCTVTFTNTESCQHKNGWYGLVKFFIFEEQIFSCSDCGATLYGQRLRDFRKRHIKT